MYCITHKSRKFVKITIKQNQQLVCYLFTFVYFYYIQFILRIQLMSKKDREKWRLQLNNKTIAEDIDKIKVIAYQMQLAITKMDEENNDLKKRILETEESLNKRVQEVHEHYMNQAKKKGNGKDVGLEKQIEELTKRNLHLTNLVKKLEQQLKAKDQDLVKVLNINKSNGAQYQITSNHLKAQYEKRIKGYEKDLANSTANFNKFKYQGQNQLKRIIGQHERQKKLLIDNHQKEIAKLQSNALQYKTQRQNQIRKEVTVFYQNQILQIKNRNTMDLQDTKRSLLSVQQNNIKKIERQYQAKLAIQMKNVEDLKAQITRLIKNQQNTISQLKSKADNLKITSAKQLKQVSDKFKSEIIRLQSNNVNLSLLLSQRQSTIKKLQQDKGRLQRGIQSLKNESQRRVANNQSFHQKNIEKINNDHKNYIQKLNNDNKIVNDKLKLQIYNLNQSCNQYSLDINKLQETNNKLQKDIKDSNQQISKKERQIKRINDLMNKKQQQIERLKESIKMNLSKVNDLNNTLGKMIPIEQVNKLNQDHHIQIENMKRQLWSTQETINSMVPKDELERAIQYFNQQKQKQKQQYDEAQNIMIELKNKFEENQRSFKETISQLKYRHKQQISQIMSENQNKILMLKQSQSQEIERRNNKNLTAIQQTKEEIKQQLNRQIAKIKEQHRKTLQDLNNEKKKEINQFKSQIQNWKTKNSQLQREMESLKVSTNQQKQEIFGKVKNDQVTIVNLKAKIDQYQVRQKKSQTIIGDHEHHLIQLKKQLQQKQNKYRQQIRRISEANKQQNHQRQIQQLKRNKNQSENIQNIKSKYQGIISQLERKYTGERKTQNDNIMLLQKRITEKDKEIQNISCEYQNKINSLLINYEKKEDEQKLMQRKLYQNMGEIKEARIKDYELMVKVLTQKNNQLSEQVIALETSNQTLRQQITSGLARGNKEKELYQQVNRLKAQLKNSEKRSIQIDKKIDSLRDSIVEDQIPSSRKNSNMNIKISSHSNLFREQNLSQRRNPNRLNTYSREPSNESSSIYNLNIPTGKTSNQIKLVRKDLGLHDLKTQRKKEN